MCPKRLPEPANAGPQAGGCRASLARSGRARDPTKWSRAQRVKLVLCRAVKRTLKTDNVAHSLNPRPIETINQRSAQSEESEPTVNAAAYEITEVRERSAIR